MDNNYSLFQWHLFVSAVWWMLCPRDSVWPTKVGWAPKHFSMYWYDTRCFWLFEIAVRLWLNLHHRWITRSVLFDLKKDLGAIANPMFKLKGPTMVQGSYNPAFPLKHQQKDMRLALALGDENAVAMPVSAAANEVRHTLLPNFPTP